jgi:hypothetical protein
MQKSATNKLEKMMFGTWVFSLALKRKRQAFLACLFLLWTIDFTKDKWSRWTDLNRRPDDYKSTCIYYL